MRKRLPAVAAAALAAAIVAAAPAGAQAYPPPVRSITVDDPTPAPGQAITVAMRTCTPGTVALLGIDLWLVAAPTVGPDGAARASATVPRAPPRAPRRVRAVPRGRSPPVPHHDEHGRAGPRPAGRRRGRRSGAPPPPPTKM